MHPCKLIRNSLGITNTNLKDIEIGNFLVGKYFCRNSKTFKNIGSTQNISSSNGQKK